MVNDNDDDELARRHLTSAAEFKARFERKHKNTRDPAPAVTLQPLRQHLESQKDDAESGAVPNQAKHLEQIDRGIKAVDAGERPPEDLGLVLPAAEIERLDLKPTDNATRKSDAREAKGRSSSQPRSK